MRETSCDHSRLVQLLEESLPEREAQAASAHVAECDQCRHALEELAGDESWWNETRQRLSGVPSGSVSQFGELYDEAAAFLVADFAVDFLEPSLDETALGRLGEYEIVEIIGHGGMGVVLKGFQKELHRHVAVKVLSPHLATSGAARKRFAREAQATAAVVHPHVMAIHSVNAAGKLPYFVMPYVACQSLQERLDQHGPLDVKDVLRIGMQAALGLAAAHAQGLVHRDVKPANILLETNVDRVLLTDFGLARAVDDASLTRTGIIAGTPQYMSPEQANGDAIDHRSDLFSLGSVLYAMCTGRPPFRGDTTFGVLRRIREDSPRSIREINSDIPEWLERIVMKLLEKESGDRLDSAEQVATLLEQCLAHLQQPTAVPLPEGVKDWKLVPVAESSRVTPERLRFHTRDALVAGIAVFAIAIGVTYVMWNATSRTGSQDENPNVAVTDSNVSPTRTQTEAAELPDVPLDWNATRTELDAASSQIERLESSMQSDLNSTEPTQPNSEAPFAKDGP